jgi:hypothetical protein
MKCDGCMDPHLLNNSFTNKEIIYLGSITSSLTFNLVLLNLIQCLGQHFPHIPKVNKKDFMMLLFTWVI